MLNLELEIVCDMSPERIKVQISVFVLNLVIRLQRNKLEEKIPTGRGSFLKLLIANSTNIVLTQRDTVCTHNQSSVRNNSFSNSLSSPFSMFILKLPELTQRPS